MKDKSAFCKLVETLMEDSENWLDGDVDGNGHKKTENGDEDEEEDDDDEEGGGYGGVLGMMSIGGGKSSRGGNRKRKRRLRSRNTVVDKWLADEDGSDAYADLEDFIMEDEYT